MMCIDWLWLLILALLSLLMLSCLSSWYEVTEMAKRTSYKMFYVEKDSSSPASQLSSFNAVRLSFLSNCVFWGMITRVEKHTWTCNSTPKDMWTVRNSASFGGIRLSLQTNFTTICYIEINGNYILENHIQLHFSSAIKIFVSFQFLFRHSLIRSMS